MRPPSQSPAPLQSDRVPDGRSSEALPLGVPDADGHHDHDSPGLLSSRVCTSAPLGPIGLKAQGRARCPPRRSAAGRHGSPQADLGRLQSRAEAPAAPDRGERYVARLSENSERLYESDNGVLGGPHRSAAGGRSGAPETEMAQRRIDFLSLMYKKSSDPGNSPTASRPSDRQPRCRADDRLRGKAPVRAAPR
jgi:hypothetical protein